MFLLDFFQNTESSILVFVAFFILAFIFLGVVLILVKHNKEVYHYAYIDSLTGLKNMNWFNRKASEVLKNKRDKNYVLYSFDIKNFKYINECYGRDIGDQVLIAIASSLDKLSYSLDTLVTRRDTDKFLLLTTFDIRSNIETSVNIVTKRLTERIQKDFNFVLEFTTGIYVVDTKVTDISKAVDRAEIARKEAKKSLSTDRVFFDEQMAQTIHLEKMMEENMEYALNNNEFEVYLQPQYNLENFKLVGVESLVRWNSSKLGFLCPDTFINFFEKNGFISKLDFFVTKVVCDRLQNLFDEDKPLYHISVNHSRVTIMDDDYLFNLERFLSKYTFPKKFIEIEITETVFIDNHKQATEIIDGIKRLGVGVSMDDFGSGYSSLNVLKRLSFNVLKLDKDFLDEQMSLKTLAIVKGVVNMAKDIKIHVICEGVETKEQVDFLRDIGCDMAQGFYFAKPMTMESFDNMLTRKPIC